MKAGHGGMVGEKKEWYDKLRGEDIKTQIIVVGVSLLFAIGLVYLRASGSRGISYQQHEGEEGEGRGEGEAEEKEDVPSATSEGTTSEGESKTADESSTTSAGSKKKKEKSDSEGDGEWEVVKDEGVKQRKGQDKKKD
jgi:hypothetical protein